MNGFLIDTNVISELVRPRPERRVADWLRGIEPPLLYLSVLTLGELRQGIAAHPDPVRRVRIEAWVEATLRPWFEDRILPIDMPVAERWGLLAGQARMGGRPLPVIDGLLAATALQHDLTLVTRNIEHVAPTGVSHYCPWP